MKNGKRKINKKILLGFVSLLACIGIIVVTSFFPFIIDPSKFLTKEFLTNELIIVAIVIFATISTIFIGQASNSSNPNSEIAKAKVSFNESMAKITNINAFFQWVRKVLQPEDIKLIKERELRKVGIEDFEILKLEISEIEKLVNEPLRIGGHYYKKITEEQAKAVIYIKTKLKIFLVQPNYYLTFNSNDVDKTITERSSNESKKKTNVIIISILSKLSMTIAIAMIFASFVPLDNSETITQTACWMTFISRISAMVSSSFMGFMIGSQINDIDADYIRMRVMVHKKFLEDKDFKPLSQQEEAREELVERVKKENQQVLMIGEIKDGK